MLKSSYVLESRFPRARRIARGESSKFQRSRPCVRTYVHLTSRVGKRTFARLRDYVAHEATLTIGSSVFFWNCTSLTRVTFSRSKSPFCPSRSSLPFRYGRRGGGVTLVASSPYTSCPATSCACRSAWKQIAKRNRELNVSISSGCLRLRGYDWVRYDHCRAWCNSGPVAPLLFTNTAAVSRRHMYNFVCVYNLHADRFIHRG